MQRYSVLALPVTGLNVLESLPWVSVWLSGTASLGQVVAFWLPVIPWLLAIVYVAPIFLRRDRQSLGGIVSHTVNVAERGKKEEHKDEE